MSPEQALEQGVQLHRQGRIEDAERIYRAVLAEAPNHPATLHLIGLVHHHRRENDQAIALIEQSLAIAPQNAAAQHNLGEVHKAKGDFVKAEQHARLALQIDPNYPPSYVSLAENLMSLGRVQEAEPVAHKAAQLLPNDPGAHMVLARYYLLTGQLTKAWPHYEWRVKKYPHLKRELPGRRYTGGKVAEQTIVIISEQGYGDMIQFMRYAGALADRGAEVLCLCDPPLKRLMQRVDGVAGVWSPGEALPRFDMYIPILSLPVAFNTSLKSIPTNVPYVKAHPQLASAWAGLVKHDQTTKVKVGLAWAGRPSHEQDRFRSVPPDALAPLAQVSGVAFYNLQKTPTAAAPPAELKLIDLQSRVHDFADLAALIANLDVVISADTAAAHLAGAMGKPVWTMLPFAPEWRWMLDRDDSPWYPTMKLFRQPSAGDWSTVVARLKSELETLVGR